VKIFIDDERYPLREEQGEWVIVRTPLDALAVIEANAPWITHISFDNDLGFEIEGRDILQVIVGNHENKYPMVLPRLEEIRVHSANVVAAQAILDLARSAQKHGVIRADVNIVQRSALHEKYDMPSSWYDDFYETEKERLADL